MQNVDLAGRGADPSPLSLSHAPDSACEGDRLQRGWALRFPSVAWSAIILAALILTLATACARQQASERAPGQSVATSAPSAAATRAPATAAPTATLTAIPSATATALPTAVPTPTPAPARLTASYPIDRDRAVVAGRPLVLELSAPVDPLAVQLSVVVEASQKPLSGQVAWPSPQRLEWTPGAPLAPETWHALTLSGGALAEPITLRFQRDGRGAPVPILMYHHVAELGPNASESTRTWTVSPAALAEQVDYLVREGYRSITPTQLADYLERGAPLPPKPVVITFDDGYKEVYDNARPIFARTSLRPTLFIITGDTGYSAMMDWGQIRDLVKEGYAVGSHSSTHVDLAGKDAATLKAELKDSKDTLERELGLPIDAFCYPYGGGAWKDAVNAALRQYGYRTGFTLNPTANQLPSEPLRLGRLRISYEMTLADVIDLLP